MERAEAVRLIKANWPDERYGGLREALNIAIADVEAAQAQAATGHQPTKGETIKRSICRKTESCPYAGGKRCGHRCGAYSV
jgi:hypothetical protein